MKPELIGPDDDLHRIHTYFKGSPYHLDGRRILYTRFRSLEDTASVCLLDRESGAETVLGESDFFTYHHGAAAYFCDGGDSVIFQRDEQTVGRHDLGSGEQKHFEGAICLYSGHLDQHFIEIDEDHPVEAQGEMGIYLRCIDGTQRTCLATVDELLDANPQGASIRRSEVLIRLGAEIRPDQQQITLFLVTRQGALIRDYYLCDMDGSSLDFHGRLGTHIMWHPNCRDILAFVSPGGSSYFGHLRGEDTIWDHGLLASYNTHTREMALLSDHQVRGGCHVSPSPDGTKIVLDSLQPETLEVLLYDCATGEMRVLWEEPRDLRVERESEDRLSGYTHGYKHYDVNAHPTFSRDGRRILYNSCTDGQLRLAEIEL